MARKWLRGDTLHTKGCGQAKCAIILEWIDDGSGPCVERGSVERGKSPLPFYTMSRWIEVQKDTPVDNGYWGHSIDNRDSQKGRSVSLIFMAQEHNGRSEWTSVDNVVSETFKAFVVSCVLHLIICSPFLSLSQFVHHHHNNVKEMFPRNVFQLTWLLFSFSHSLSFSGRCLPPWLVKSSDTIL